MATYTCRYCGWQTSNSNQVNNCVYSPSRSHVWMNATEKLSQYTCRYCGWQTSNPNQVASCGKSSHKSHEWLG